MSIGITDYEHSGLDGIEITKHPKSACVLRNGHIIVGSIRAASFAIEAVVLCGSPAQIRVHAHRRRTADLSRLTVDHGNIPAQEVIQTNCRFGQGKQQNYRDEWQ